MALVFFCIGMVLNLLLHADGVIKAKNRPEITSFVSFFRVYWLVVAARVFASLCLYAAWGYLQRVMGWSMEGVVDPLLREGMAGFAGLGLDGLFRQLTEKFPQLQRAIPELPSADTPPTGVKPEKANGVAN